MPPMQNNTWRLTTIMRGLLTIIFILWLATVIFQYNDNNIEKKPKITAANHVVIQQLVLPPVPTSAKMPKVPAISRLIKQSVEPATQGSKQSLTANKQQVEQVYKQLNDQGVDIQIAWPQKMQQQQGALDFMYHCAGMQFAVLNGNNITRLNQLKSKDYSDWIRLAQGNLSKKEQHWLTAYSLKGTPIRLFPRNIDLRLATHLADILKGSELVKLRAKYQVTNQRLYLTDIQLNNQAITASWMLYQSECI